MNVLVYAGPEVLQPSLNHILVALRSILIPHYSVQTITQQALKTQPWATSCALLVFPESRNVFSSPSCTAIRAYVESGGAFLGFATGAICSPRSRGGIIAGHPALSLCFFDKSTGNYIYPTSYQGNDSPRSVTIQASDGGLIEGISLSGPEFVEFEERGGVTVLARYFENGTTTSAAGLKCRVGEGSIALWAPNLENPITEQPASTLPSRSITWDVALAEKQRLELLKATLLSLALQLPFTQEQTASHPLPQFLTSQRPATVSQITDSIAAPSLGSQLSILEDDVDTFYFHPHAESGRLVQEIRTNPGTVNDSSDRQLKHIILCTNTLPDREETPLFDSALYYECLSTARIKQGIPEATDSWGIGQVLLYGEVVTSTQTMLDKNHRLLSRLPVPFVSLASHQLAGRGRGANIWLSPSGCLQFSVVLRVALTSFPASKLVFVQYLFALAVVEACRDESVLGRRGSDIRIKWPNDLYAIVGSKENERKKVGGILVNTNFSSGNVDIVIGCGLNVLNSQPIPSLVQLLPSDERSILSIERTVATILATFETMWTIFVRDRGSFDSFMNLYLERWLHSDQLVTLTTFDPPKLVRITGITTEHGLLRTLPEKAGWPSSDRGYIDLQPDGNSFDLMSGLIKAKN